MFKNKSKKLIFRILLLMLVDAMIITLAGPVAIYIRYNLLFEPRAIEFIEHIFRYLPLNLVITIAHLQRAVFIRGSGSMPVLLIL